jgi:hypothetical protein
MRDTQHAAHDNRAVLDIRRAIMGYQLSQALHVAATLNIVELLDGGPRTAAELAEAAGADPQALYRLLRALARAGVFEERADRVFALNDGAEQFRSARGQAAFIGRYHHWNTWSMLVESVRTGEPAFHAIYGASPWEWRQEHPEESALFDDFMTSTTRGVDETIVAGFDFGRFSHVVDVGGGQGALLAAILRAHPAMTGTLFDQEHVVAGAPRIERCRVVAGNFFEEIPRGGDAYVLKTVIHDWDDESSVRILRTCAAALEGDAQVLLVEHDLSDPATAFMDLQMLVMLGGRERSEDEYAALFAAAGLDYVGATSVGVGFAVYGAATSPSR